MRKLILVFFILTFQSTYCQKYWKINTLSKHEDKIDVGQNIKNISLKNKSLTSKILRVKDDEFIKIDFPNEKGELELFSLKETKTLSQIIQNKYPNIKTFRGFSETRKNVILRITYSPQGISGTLRTPKGFVFLQKHACGVEGGEWNTRCWNLKTHGGWVRVGECGLVFEVVVALTKLWPCGVAGSCEITGSC